MAVCEVAPPVATNAGHVTRARLNLTPVSPTTPTMPAPPSAPPPAAPQPTNTTGKKNGTEFSLEDVEKEEDETVLQTILGQLTDMR